MVHIVPIFQFLDILYLIYASDLQYLLSSFLRFLYLLFIVHQHTKTNSSYVKTYLALKQILKTVFYFLLILMLWSLQIIYENIIFTDVLSLCTSATQFSSWFPVCWPCPLKQRLWWRGAPWVHIYPNMTHSTNPTLTKFMNLLVQKQSYGLQWHVEQNICQYLQVITCGVTVIQCTNTEYKEKNIYSQDHTIQIMSKQRHTIALPLSKKKKK